MMLAMTWTRLLCSSSRALCAGVLIALSLTQSALAETKTQPAKIVPGDGEFPSSTPHYLFADTLAEQEAQLAENPLMLRFAASRRAFASDPYRPAYHFVSPESRLNDPNGLSLWQGRWHLFYQAYPVGARLENSLRENFLGHAVSDDLIHWRDLPHAIYPGVEEHLYTGKTLVENDRVIAVYPGGGIGKPHPFVPGLSAAMMIATSSDPLLLNWKKSAPIEIPVFDTDIWKQGDTYHVVVGSLDRYYPQSSVTPVRFEKTKWQGVGVWPKWQHWTSTNLKEWKPAGDLLIENTPFTGRYDDGACPNFQKIGDKYIMIFFSHSTGGQYLLGDYDEAEGKFRPYDHGRFNHGQLMPGGVFAPSAVTDSNGDVINILSIGAGKPTIGWDAIMSLPQRLSLDSDKRLSIEPIETAVSLRGKHRQVGETILAANEEVVLGTIRGNVMELEVEIDPQDAQQVQLNVLRSPDAQERTSITFFNYSRAQNPRRLLTAEEIVLDGSESSILNDVSPRPPERAELKRKPGESLKLRIFIDRSVIEVYANGKQYLAMRIYPGRRDSLGISLRSRGGNAVLKRLDAWQMSGSGAGLLGSRVPK